MNKNEIIRRILNPGIFAIMRADSSEHLLRAAGALLDGGVEVMEVTLTTPGALQLIEEIRARYGEKIVMGAGSILNSAMAATAIRAGAEFVVTPVTSREVIRYCNEQKKTVIAGAFTPTEAWTAQEIGADFVKIFPADDLGPKYIKNLLAPMPTLRLVPTGGVTLENIAGYISAGSVAVAAGGSLMPKLALENQDWESVMRNAKEMVEAIHRTRGS